MIATDYKIVTLDANDKITPRITLLPYGRTKQGKTELALSAPGDLGILCLDANCKAVVQKFYKSNPDKKIHFVEFRRNPLARVEDINELKKYWASIRDAYYHLLETPKIRTVIVDTHTQMWEECKLAFVGKDKPDLSSEVDKHGKPTGTRIGTQKTMQRDLGEPKKEIREMINAAGDKNLILICQGDDEYKNDAKTGRLKAKGMPGIEFMSQCEIECFRSQESGEFIARMMSSTTNADIRGREGRLAYDSNQSKDYWQASEDELVGEEINFAMIGIKVFPGTEYGDWL